MHGGCSSQARALPLAGAGRLRGWLRGWAARLVARTGLTVHEFNT